MAIDLTAIQADIDAIIADEPATMTLRDGTVVSVAISEINKTDDVAADGVFNINGLSALAKLSAFPSSTPPAVRDTVTVASVKYYVDAVSKDSVSVVLTLKRV